MVLKKYFFQNCFRKLFPGEIGIHEIGPCSKVRSPFWKVRICPSAPALKSYVAEASIQWVTWLT
jgi:hypothetical protein